LLGVVLLALASVGACSYTPDSVEKRPRLPSCGQYESKHEPYSSDQLRQNRCLLDALDEGRQAELIVTLAPLDGGPVTESVRVLGPGRIELFVDSTADTEAGPGARWSRWLCRDLQEVDGYLERVGCRKIPLEDGV